MNELGNGGCRIISFKTIYGLTEDHKRLLARSDNSFELKKDQYIVYIDFDGDTHRLTNNKTEPTIIQIIGNNILYNQEQVTQLDLGTIPFT